MRVMKFGGASVATATSFHRIAELIALEKGEPTVIVVSAMGSTTDDLLRLAHEVHSSPPKRELDMLVSVGERVSIALLAMALHAKGMEAVSFTGSQSGIITCNNHFEARIVHVHPERVLAALKEQKIVIVAGFQGVSKLREITTLGRGGSDTSAVALAVALGAERVHFYKDVEGIYSADPKVDPSARLIAELHYEEALALAQKGAKILHSRSIELARKNGVQLYVRSFKNQGKIGTIVGKGVLRNKTIEYEKEN